VLRLRNCGLVLVAALLPAIALAQEEKTHTVSLDVKDASVQELASMLGRATDVSVLVSPSITDTVSVKVDGVQLEDAVKAVAEAIKGSWLRAYVVEANDAAQSEESADATLEKLQTAWRDWMFRCTDEELDGFRDRALAARQGQPLTPPQATAGNGIMFDGVDMVRGPFHVEEISLKLDGVSVRKALDQFTLQSGYMTLLSPGVEGQVTLDVTNEKLAGVLDAIAAQANAQWRPVYLIGQPREVTADEIDQFVAQQLQDRTAEFFQLPPEERQQIIQRISDRLANIPPEARTAIKNSPWAPRIMSRVMQFVLTLTPDQRREVAPLLQGVGRLMSQ